jgi:ABC-type oligopeptide transport system substrate-binding subunit
MGSREREIRLKRSGSYHGIFPGNVEELIFIQEKDNHIGFEMYAHDELDMHWPWPPLFKPAWKAFPKEFRAFSTTCIDMLVFNPYREPFTDENVRKALCICCDLDAAEEDFARQYPFGELDGRSVVKAGGGILPEGHPAHSPGINCTFDPVLAKTLFARSGLNRGDGKPLFTITAPAFPIYLADVVQSQWRTRLGIEFHFRPLPWDEYLECANTFDYQVLAFRFAFHAPDVYSWLPPGLEVWNDEEFQTLKRRLETSRTTEDRIDRVKEIDRLALEHAIVWPIAYVLLAHPLLKPWIQFHAHWKANFDSYKNAVVLPH